MPLASQLTALSALVATYFAHIGFFNPYLPLWLKETGMSLVTISLLVSLQSASRLVAPYAWGWVSDRTGRRSWLLRYAALASLALSLGLWLDGGFVGLFVVLLLLFCHTSGMMPMSEALLAQLLSREGSLDTRRYGRVRVLGSIGFLVTVIAAGWWFERAGMSQFPMITCITLAAVALSAWCLPSIRDRAADPATQASVLPLLQQRAIQLFFASTFFHVLSHIGIYVFFSLYLDELGYSKTMIGLMWALSVLVEVVWFFTQSRWLAGARLGLWLVICAGIMTVRMAMTAAAADVLWILVLAQALHAITFAAHHTVCIAWLARHFPGALRGRGQALYTVIAYGLTGVLGGVIGGLVSSHWGLVTVFWLCVPVALLGMITAWGVWRLERA
ncbi:MAG: MFS transporter [Betaproteobacteria bacterium]